MIYRGRELTATISATFQAKRADITKVRSTNHEKKNDLVPMTIVERDDAPKYSGRKAMLITYRNSVTISAITM